MRGISLGAAASQRVRRQEVVTIYCGPNDTTSDTNGNSITVDAGGVVVMTIAGAGWVVDTSLGLSVQFRCLSYGPKGTTLAGGNGTVTVDVVGR